MWFFKPIWKLNILDVVKTIGIIFIIGLVFLGPLALLEPSPKDKRDLSYAMMALAQYEASNGSCTFADFAIEHILDESNKDLSLLECRIIIVAIKKC